MVNLPPIVERGQAIIGAYSDQLRAQALEFLGDQGRDWTKAFDEMTQRMMDEGATDAEIATGLFAQIGICSTLENYQPCG